MERTPEIIELSVITENLIHQYKDMLTMLSNLSIDIYKLESKCDILDDRISNIEEEFNNINRKQTAMENEMTKMKNLQRWLSVKI